MPQSGRPKLVWAPLLSVPMGYHDGRGGPFHVVCLLRPVVCFRTPTDGHRRACRATGGAPYPRGLSLPQPRRLFLVVRGFLDLVESQRPDAMDVFMPPEDLNVAMLLAVVSIEPSNVFVTATSAVQAAMLRNLGHLSFNTMSSSMGVCYLRFSCWEDHK
ncbi:hypothetical protein ZWY2020_052833 [Hordeum vulgare]|nr:hypothetical protein ZWY2020_052833 [Hordeum vulgare]